MPSSSPALDVFDLSWVSQPEAWIALAALTTLEIVLGIDNIVFISILSAKLPAAQQAKAQRLGLGAALVGRVVLLLSISWIMQLTTPLVSVLGHAVSGRDLIVLAGGLFLIAKSTREIHDKLEGPDADEAADGAGQAAFASVIGQIFLLDMVFSLDSVITAVGMADHVLVMIIAVTLAIALMLVSVDTVSDFISRHPTLKMLALSFLLLIGVMLVAEGAGQHIPKGYIYTAMAFALGVEMLNLRVHRAREEEGEAPEPVQLHRPRLREAVRRATDAPRPADEGA
jgi:predicted tellurium resistance membrane protein TerC